MSVKFAQRLQGWTSLIFQTCTRSEPWLRPNKSWQTRPTSCWGISRCFPSGRRDVLPRWKTNRLENHFIPVYSNLINFKSIHAFLWMCLCLFLLGLTTSCTTPPHGNDKDLIQFIHKWKHMKKKIKVKHVTIHRPDLNWVLEQQKHIWVAFCVIKKEGSAAQPCPCFLCSPNKEAAVTMPLCTVPTQRGSEEQSQNGRRCLFILMGLNWWERTRKRALSCYNTKMVWRYISESTQKLCKEKKHKRTGLHKVRRHRWGRDVNKNPTRIQDKIENLKPNLSMVFAKSSLTDVLSNSIQQFY